MGQRQYYDRFNMESANVISSEWNKSHQNVLDDCQTQKNKSISHFFTVCKENGSETNLMEDLA
jgi:hypothetical protein